jgi:trigger factor
MPNVVRKDLDNTSAILTVTITRDELKPKLDSELKRFRQRAAIKGFRQGQAPMEFVKRLYGGSIFSETLNDLLSTQLYDYIRESGLDVLGQPLPSDDQQKFSFKISDPDAEYAVKYEIGHVPKFEIKGLDKSQSFERLTVSNLDELAADDLAYARKRMGARTNPTDDIQENDILRIASREIEGDTLKDGGWEATVTVLVKDVVDADLKALLLSKKAGDVITFNPRLIEKEGDEHKYRKYILALPDEDDRAVGDLFEGTIEEVSRVTDAELNEEFYQNYFGGNVSNEEEAINELKNGIRSFYDTRSDAMLMRSFQDGLLKNNTIELPENFLRRWLNATNEGKLTPDAIDAELPAFMENLKWTMLRDKIKEMFDVEITDADIKEEYRKRVRAYFKVDLPDHIIDTSVDRLMADKKEVDETKETLETDRVFNAIRDQVTITERAVPSEEFHKLLEEMSNSRKKTEVASEILDAEVIEE